MNINAKRGDKVIVTLKSIINGYQSDMEKAKRWLEPYEMSRKVYTVDEITIYEWCTNVCVKEIPGVVFNSANFEDYESISDLNLNPIDPIKKTDEWESNSFKYGIQVLLSEKPVEKNILKALEELNELSVKLLQYLNKPEVIRDGDIEEEIVDCEMHFHVLKHYFPVSREIREEKIKKFLASKDYNYYREQFERIIP